MMQEKDHHKLLLSTLNRICTFWRSQNTTNIMLCSCRINKVTES